MRLAAIPRGAGACRTETHLTEAAAIRWRLDVVLHGHRMTAAALEYTGDMNEAKFLVHSVMARAMAAADGPVSRRDLDTDLARALRRRMRER